MHIVVQKWDCLSKISRLTSCVNIVILLFTVVQTGALQLTSHGEATPASQGLQTLTMTNASPTSASNSTGGTTIVQYAQGPDGQFYIPGKGLYLFGILHLFNVTLSFLPLLSVDVKRMHSCQLLR